MNMLLFMVMIDPSTSCYGFCFEKQIRQWYRIKVRDISRLVFALTKEIFYVIVTMYRFVKAVLVWDFEVLFYINFDKILLNKVKIISKRSICRAIDWVLKSLTVDFQWQCILFTCMHSEAQRHTVQIQWLFEWSLIGWPCILLMSRTECVCIIC